MERKRDRETERRRDGELERRRNGGKESWRDGELERRGGQAHVAPNLPVSPSLRLSVSLSLCLSFFPSFLPPLAAQKPAAGVKSDLSAARLIEQGKALYRAQRLKPALAKFE